LLLDAEQAVGEVYNVGSEEEVSIVELAERILKATGSSSELRFIPYGEVYGDQYEDMLKRSPDTTKIRNALGWVPEHDLDSIISRTVAYANQIGPETLLDG
jgi:UDP-glucose 4-epimerase